MHEFPTWLHKDGGDSFRPLLNPADIAAVALRFKTGVERDYSQRGDRLRGVASHGSAESRNSSRRVLAPAANTRHRWGNPAEGGR